MIHIPRLVIGRRPLLIGAAGTAMALAARAPVHAQPAAPLPAGPGGGTGGQSAVIDVNHARSAPIPIAIPDLSGADGNSAQLGRDIAQVITNDLGNCGLFRPLPPASFIQAALNQGEVPNFQNWSAIGAQAVVTGRTEVQGGNIRVEFRLWDGA